MSTKLLMMGNTAVARGAWEAGVGLGIGYPGTPSTEILEALASYEGPEVTWAVNEKVALEEAWGASLAGLRSLVTMKHVGLNVAADPLFTAAYLGVNAGLVVVTADDPSLHSSQNEQDNRWYGLHAKVPVVEPADSEECRLYTRWAFELSEQYDVPVILRLVTRVSHSYALVTVEDVAYARPPREYVRNPMKFAALPARCRARRKVLEENLARLAGDAALLRKFNVAEFTNPEVGIITSGASYNYVKDAYGDRYSVLKLGLVYPFDSSTVLEFARQVRRVLVVEELDPYLELHVKALGISCEGKKDIPVMFELNPQIVARSLAGAGLEPLAPPEPALAEPLPDVPERPPLLCAGCPHRGFFYAAKQERLTVTSDIGCYSLAGMQPLDALDTVLCMGGGYTVGLGLALGCREGKIFGVMGDSTFYHSGLPGIVEGAYNKRAFVPVVLDNRVTAMTGHQPNPGTGRLLKGDAVPAQDPVRLLEAAGYSRVLVLDAYDLEGMRAAIREAKETPELVALVVKGPCRLIKGVARGAARRVEPENCKKCKACMRLGCPALSLGPEGFPEVDALACAGCGLCDQVCRHGAIVTGSEGGACS